MINRRVLALIPILLIVILYLFYANRGSDLKSKEFALTDTAAKLIEEADSIRNSDPKTALDDYNKAISHLENSNKDKIQRHHLSNSYAGIANIYSETGEFKLALKNDSIAMEFANQFNDKQMQAKSFVMRGTTLYRLAEYDKALNCYEKAEKLAIEINDFKIQAKIFANRAMIYFYQGNHQKTIEGFTKALNIGKQIKDKMLVAGNYMNLAIVYNNLSKNDSVMAYDKLALELFKQLNDKNGELLCYQNIGNLYYSLSDFEKAIEYYEFSVNLALKLNDKTNTAKGYHNLSQVYSHIGDNIKATDLLFKSIVIKEQLDDKLSLAKGYMGIGQIYYDRNDYQKARTYFEKSLKLCQGLKCLDEIGSNYSNIANILSAGNKSDSAIAYFNKALEIYRQTDYIYGVSNMYINLGAEYSIKRKYSLAEKFLLLGLKSKTDQSDDEGSAIVNYHLAGLYLKEASTITGNAKTCLYRKAEEAGLQSYNIAKRIGTIPVRRDASNMLKKIYQKLGMYADALIYSEIFSSLNDSLLNKDKIQALTFAEARWNIDKKQHEIDILEHTQKLQLENIQRKEAEARQHKITIWFIAILFISSLVSTVIIALYIRKRRDAIYQKQVANITALRMQNTRNTMSPHFFLNVLTTLSGLSTQPERLKEKLRSLALLLRKMIENIDQMAIPLEEEIKAVKAYIDLYREKIPGSLTVKYLISKETNLDGHIPAMMIQIPVENAIKHGLMPLDGDKILTISISASDEYQNILIEDNGIGLKASTGRSSGTGTGLKVLLQTIHLLNAKNQYKINFSVGDREPNNAFSTGTVVSIKIPNEFNYTI